MSIRFGIVYCCFVSGHNPTIDKSCLKKKIYIQSGPNMEYPLPF